MIPGMNPKQLEKAMKKMGMKQEPIECYEVVLKTPEGNFIIKNPEVMKVNMMGQESLQITGDIEQESSITDEDIETVVSQTGVSRKEAKLTLEKNKGDLAETILELKKE
ncbi:nascent polypeptide-associated complex protein [Candidatus Woesearchaeota archaeon]|nr:nascent polypeptide-associated complex protein [Candidatus Woesearchaeota archaeon]